MASIETSMHASTPRLRPGGLCELYIFILVPLTPSPTNLFRNHSSSWKQHWTLGIYFASQTQCFAFISLYSSIVPSTNPRFRQVFCEWFTSWGYSWGTGRGDGGGGGSRSSDTAGRTGAEEEAEEKLS